MAITRLIIRNSLRVRVLRDRLKYDQRASFRDIDGTFDNRVTDRAGIQMLSVIKDP